MRNRRRNSEASSKICQALAQPRGLWGLPEHRPCVFTLQLDSCSRFETAAPSHQLQSCQIGQRWPPPSPSRRAERWAPASCSLNHQLPRRVPVYSWPRSGEAPARCGANLTQVHGDLVRVGCPQIPRAHGPHASPCAPQRCPAASCAQQPAPAWRRGPRSGSRRLRVLGSQLGSDAFCLL